MGEFVHIGEAMTGAFQQIEDAIKRREEKGGGSMNETDLIRQIRDLLNIKGIWHKKIWQGPMSDKGIADIIGIYKGKFLAIEVKGPRGKVSAEQYTFLFEVTERGGIGFIAWSVEDVIRELGIEGVKM